MFLYLFVYLLVVVCDSWFVSSSRVRLDLDYFFIRAFFYCLFIVCLLCCLLCYCVCVFFNLCCVVVVIVGGLMNVVSVLVLCILFDVCWSRNCFCVFLCVLFDDVCVSEMVVVMLFFLCCCLMVLWCVGVMVCVVMCDVVLLVEYDVCGWWWCDDVMDLWCDDVMDWWCVSDDVVCVRVRVCVCVMCDVSVW